MMCYKLHLAAVFDAVCSKFVTARGQMWPVITSDQVPCNQRAGSPHT